MTEASAPACGAFINNSVRVKIFSWCVRGRRGERPPPTFSSPGYVVFGSANAIKISVAVVCTADYLFLNYIYTHDML